MGEVFRCTLTSTGMAVWATAPEIQEARLAASDAETYETLRATVGRESRP